MANQEYLDLLKRGVAEWNRWRAANPISAPDLSEADLSEADLREADLWRADLRGAHLQQANLWRAHLQRTDLQRTDLRGAHLGEAELHRADLSEADLRDANLWGAQLVEAHLSWADFTGADLTGADFTGAHLSWAYLQGAYLQGADLSGAHLSGANLTRANLTRADLHEAILGGTVFGDIDLSGVQGLDTVVHRRPSTIGIDTLYRSGGNIPAAFLRGSGVPDSFIDYIPSLIGAQDVIQYYSCFISYSSQDEALAKRLHADLQANHVRVWFAPEDLKIGDRIRIGIDESIRVYDKLLLILSQHSLASQWVEQCFCQYKRGPFDRLKGSHFVRVPRVLIVETGAT